MRRILSILMVALFLGAGFSAVPVAYAQDRGGDVAGALSRLKNNPRYQGRILGTHVKRDRGRVLYEVRILRPDDRIILVYIDPETGGVIGDSDRRRDNRIQRRQGDDPDRRNMRNRPGKQDNRGRRDRRRRAR